jgi:twitching motility protein PilJ
MAISVRTHQIIIFILSLLMGAAILLAIYSMTLTANNDRSDRALQNLLTSIQSEIYDLMIVSQEAAIGDAEAVVSLPAIEQSISDRQRRFNADAGELQPNNVRRFVDQLDRIISDIQTIRGQTENVQFLRTQLSALEQNIPRIQQAYTTVVDTMLRTGAPADQVAEAQAQVWRSERALASLRSILGGNSLSGNYDAVAAAEQFRNDVLLFSEVLVGMRDGNRLLGITRVVSPEARALLEQVEAQFEGINTSVESLIEASPSLSVTSDAATAIIRTGADLLSGAQILSLEIASLPERFDIRPFSTPMVFFAATTAAILAFLIGLLVVRNTRSSLRYQEVANEGNQEAILRLLDEIADLAEGDLTVKATVSEDFTGAIADSINYAIEQLRDLVANVVATAENVAGASNETRAIALRLNEASEHQSSQISETTRAIGSIADNLNSVSSDAEELASVAQSSVDVARTGNQVVQDSISGMSDIREQIQDTAKRIKRLGESSQEIGDIVSLINDIADQTNILALNASIQAAMAGEAGRGFAVVADEVQGLAERATGATKQIESLVRAIQTDTNETVASMEQTTSEVVRGAELSNRAGEALREIRTTSERLSTLILAISKSANEQSEQANRASKSMRVISDITEQTLAGSAESERAIGALAEQAIRLRGSVDDFKLPQGAVASSFISGQADHHPHHQTSDITDVLLENQSADSIEELAEEVDVEAGPEEDFAVEESVAEDVAEVLADVVSEGQADDIEDEENDLDKTHIMQAPDMPASDINQTPETDDPLVEEIEAQGDEPEEDLDDDFDLGEDDDFLSFDIDLDDEDPKS